MVGDLVVTSSRSTDKIDKEGLQTELMGLWAPCAAFMVCNGRSLDDHPIAQMGRRGIASLGVNNAAARAPVKAWVFGDPQSKFHHGLFLDPSVMTFAPHTKMKKKIKVKLEDGFHNTSIRVRQCPNTYQYWRRTGFDPDTFFDTPFAHWGSGKHQPEGVDACGLLATFFCGLRLLHHLGVRRVYLMGVDHYGGRRRWNKEDKAFRRLKPVFENHGFEIFNCNAKSRCEEFQFVPFSDALIDCQGSVPDEPFDVSDWYSKSLVKESCKGNDVFTPKHFGTN